MRFSSFASEFPILFPSEDRAKILLGLPLISQSVLGCYQTMNILTGPRQVVSRKIRAILFGFVNLVIFLALIPAFLLPSNAHSAQVTLAWDKSTDPTVAGYRVYYGTSSRSYPASIDVGNTTTFTVSNLPDGSILYFAATDYDTSGIESGYSNEVVYNLPPACTDSLSPTAQSFSSSGGPGTVGVASQAGCIWTASSNAPWLIITSNSSGTGNGTVYYSVSTNSGNGSRSGAMAIAGKTFTVNQSGAASCSYSIFPTSQSFSARAGTGSISVTAQSGCAWTTASNASWITITSGGSGSGNGTVNYSVAANSGGSPRTGTMTIAGQTFTVNQGGGGCSFSISPTSNSFSSSGGTGSVSVNAGSGCSWTAASNVPWITITSGGSGSGNGTVNFSVAANTGGSPRTGTMTIAEQTFTVNQDGGSCSYIIAPMTGSFLASGGVGSVSVIGDPGCSWTVVSNSSWITITSGVGGSGNGVVNYSVATYNGSYRTGTMTIAGQTFTIYQWGPGY